MARSITHRVFFSGSTGLLIIFVFMAVRLYQLNHFPPFLDEVDHIAWARDVYEAHPFTGAINGKLFGLWWMAGFGLSGEGVLWTARAATVLFGVLGLAALYRLGRDLISERAGLLAVVLYVFAPILLFYERLALMDSYTMTWGIILAWLSVRCALSPKIRNAVLCGVVLCLPLLAKATGLMLVVLPLAALIFLTPRLTRRHIRAGVIIYGVFLAVWGPFYLFLRWRGYNYFGTATSVVGTSETGGLIERFFSNLAGVLNIDSLYLSWPLLVVLIVAAAVMLWRRPRVGMFLLVIALVPLGGLMAFATKMSARYILLHVPFVLLWIACGLAVMAHQMRQKWIGPLIVGVWGVLFAIPFALQYWRDPVQLALPDLDRLEYISSDASGYGLMEVSQFLQGEAARSGGPLVVYGLLPNCGGLDLRLPDSGNVTLICPPLSTEKETQRRTTESINQYVLDNPTDDVWIAFEDVPFVDLEGLRVAYEEVQTYSRPDNRTQIVLYHVTGD